MDEAVAICMHYGLSLDELFLQRQSQSICFQSSGLKNDGFNFESYLHNLLDLVTLLQRQQIRTSLYAAKDIPVFHLYQFPELALFKMFFWRHTIYNDPRLSGDRFQVSIRNDEEARCIELCRQIAAKYVLVPTTEIWNEETSLSFLKQVRYYYEAGLFRHRDDALALIDQIEVHFRHLQTEAERGYKFLAAKPPEQREENFRLYLNDLILLENLIYVEYAQGEQTFLIYHTIDYLGTDHPAYCRKVREWLETLTKKSDLISSVGERQRNRYFMKIFQRINDLRDELVRG
ncbi:MAG: hypothetical protein OHK0039_43120 [Bacteroidia bacterium]